MKKCKICDEKFKNHSLYANHMRWKHVKPSTENLRLASIKSNEKRFGKWIQEIVKCSICGNEISIKYRENKRKDKYYCSRKCANTKKHSQETKDKISNSVIKFMNENPEFKNSCIRNIQNPNNEKRFSSKGEREIREKLKIIFGDDNVSSHRNIKLRANLSKSVDIYMIEKNIIIEYDGIWHFKKVNENHQFELQQLKDKLLNEYCIENKIKLIRIKDELYQKNKEPIFLKILSCIHNEEIKNYILY